MADARAARAAALGTLFDETRLLFHRLKAAAAALHGQGESSAGRRGVLYDLARGGPQTVPQMARARPVSRQHIQALVNELAADGLVALADNPAHKRSHLVRLTPAGTALVDDMRRRETALLRRLDPEATVAEVAEASRTLRRVREAIERIENR